MNVKIDILIKLLYLTDNLKFQQFWQLFELNCKGIKIHYCKGIILVKIDINKIMIEIVLNIKTFLRKLRHIYGIHITRPYLLVKRLLDLK